VRLVVGKGIKIMLSSIATYILGDRNQLREITKDKTTIQQNTDNFDDLLYEL
jgi:hypothetical protein